MAKKADPSIENAYRPEFQSSVDKDLCDPKIGGVLVPCDARKDAFTVAKDDEIREVLKGMNLSEVHEPILPEAPTQASMLLLRWLLWNSSQTNGICV